jgi:hypothetical protein
MAKSNKFTVHIKSAKGLTASQVKTINTAVNKAVKGSLGALDLKGKGVKFPGIGTTGIIADIKELQ